MLPKERRGGAAFPDDTRMVDRTMMDRPEIRGPDDPQKERNWNGDDLCACRGT